jgi:hypothetical protein
MRKTAMFDRCVIGAAAVTIALKMTLPPAGAEQPETRRRPPAAEMPAADQMQVAVREARDRGFLWRISKRRRSSYPQVLAARADGLHADYAGETFPSGIARGLRKPAVALEAPELQLRLLHIEDTQECITRSRPRLAQVEPELVAFPR